MTDFLSSRFVRARVQHSCAECHSDILPGHHYVRLAGLFDGDFDTSIQCIPCHALGERYIESQRANSAIMYDELGYHWGALIEEMAQYMGVYPPAGERWSWVEHRDQLAARIDDMDLTQRFYDEQAAATSRRQRFVARRNYELYLIGRRMAREMAKHSAIDYQPRRIAA